MKNQVSSQISVAEQIIDGSIAINSPDEFASILKIFPNDPALQKAYSDFLLKKKFFDEAAGSYEKATQLFLDSDKILQAIDSKISQWKIRPPSPQEARFFYSTLHASSFNDSPLRTFFSRLSYQEMLAIISKLVKVRLSTGKMLKKIGDEENDIYFVVSGSLRETVYVPLKKKDDTLYRKRASYLSENNFFGDIYPFKDQKSSNSYVEAVKRTELVRISKSNLMKLCRKYFNIELGLIDLYRIRSESDDGNGGTKVRKIGRHQLPLRINLEIFTEATKNQPVILDGYSRDISIGGICVVMDGKYNSISLIYKNIKTAKIEMSLPKEELALKVSGTIVWSREFTWKGKKIVALGFQFKEMSPKYRGMLFVLADSICNVIS